MPTRVLLFHRCYYEYQNKKDFNLATCRFYHSVTPQILDIKITGSTTLVSWKNNPDDVIRVIWVWDRHCLYLMDYKLSACERSI